MKTPDKVLNRVSLTMTIADSRREEGVDTPSLKHSFIYGVESGGLTPFELFLADMGPGDAKEITLTAGEAQQLLGCLHARLRQHSKLPATTEEVRLTVVLEGCEPAEPREIVQFMAKSVGDGGCGGGCGCGCG